jgi:hypothetical protein
MDTTSITRLCAILDVHRKKVADIIIEIACLESRHGQAEANVSICGSVFQVVALNRSYTPEAVKALDVIRLEAIRLKRAELGTWQSKTEGIEWKIKQATKPTPEPTK